MKKIILSSAVLAVSLFAGNANTGCGLGTVLIENQDTIAKQVLASTTNGTYGNQTFGISSGTLGCVQPDSFVSNDVQKFVKDNMDNLALDIANGSGESITTLSKMMNVNDVASFSKKLQENFAVIFPSSDVNSASVINSIANLV